jgi:hypothetical protein
LEREVRLTSLGQGQATLPRLGPYFLDKLLGLPPRHAAGFGADDPMNAPTIDHDGDRVAHVSIPQLLDGYPMLDDLLAGL